MSQLEASGIESHPDANGSLNSVVNGNWLALDGMFSASYGLTASQSGTTVTASAAIFDADDAVDDGGITSRIRFANNNDVKITAYLSPTTVTVNISQTVGSQAFQLYRPGQSQRDALIRGLTKRRRMGTGDDGGFLKYDATLGQLVPTTPFLTGMVIQWAGNVASIPAGWHLCDGDDGTPDLRNKFLVGAYEDDGIVAKTTIENPSGPTYTVTGGTIEHEHTTGPTASATDTLDTGVDIADASGAGDFSDTTTGHTHTIPNTNTVLHLPPYYAICFIMKL